MRMRLIFSIPILLRSSVHQDIVLLRLRLLCVVCVRKMRCSCGIVEELTFRDIGFRV